MVGLSNIPITILKLKDVYKTMNGYTIIHSILQTKYSLNVLRLKFEPGLLESHGMTITLETIVPFGKYKGKTYGQMVQNKTYCNWLLGSPWLKGPSREFLEEYFQRPKVCLL